MSNVNAPYGLAPVRHLNGSSWNGQVMKCYIAAGDGKGATFIGDPVDLASGSEPTGTCPTVALATGASGVPLVGVITAFEPDPTNLANTYRLAATARYCYVCMSPDVIYSIQADSYAVLTTVTPGYNACFKAGTGSTGDGVSGGMMDSGSTSAPAANAVFPLLVLNLLNVVGNDITAIYAQWEVIISMHRLNPNYSNSALFGALGV
jgi:hypothetical protein